MTKRDRGFKVTTAAALSGLKPAMVDYLCRSGTLIPTGERGAPGRGNPRYYTFGDVVVLRGLAALLKHGISVRRLKSALEVLRKRHGEITPTTLPAQYLVTDGRKVYFRDKRGVAEDLTARGQYVFRFVLELDTIRKDIVRKSKTLERR